MLNTPCMSFCIEAGLRKKQGSQKCFSLLQLLKAGSLLLLLLHLLPLAESSRSGGSRSHNFAPRFSPVETVSSYAFARKIRHPCGLSVVKRSISSEMAEQHQQHQQSS